MIQYLAGYLILEFLHQCDVKNQATNYVNSIPGPKLNIGATGANQLSNPVHLKDLEIKCDICSDYLKGIEFCELGEYLPYKDDQFSVVLASHVLEHVNANKVIYALNEMCRVGNHIVIVLPNPWHHGFYIGYGHKSLIYKINVPNGLLIKSMNGEYNQKIYLDPNKYKIYQ